MNTYTWAILLTWVTIFEWFLISSALLYDSVRMHMRTREAYRLAKRRSNGKRLVAFWRNRISFWFLVAGAVAFGLAVLAVVQQVKFDPPPPDTRIVGAIIRQGLIAFIFAVWRAKRGNVRLYREYDRRQAGASAIEDITKDTNKRVRKIEEKIEE